MSSKENQLNSKYEFITKIGQGGFGTAMKVLNKDDNQIYVLKKIPLNKTDENQLKQIKNEAKILSQINSEYIVKYYDSFSDGNSFNIIMEYCDGLDLRKYISDHKEKNNLIEKSIIYHIIQNICYGLQEIHNKNMIHRDLKPDNLFLSENFKIKIGDFGIAKQLNSGNDFTKTQVGTLLYMAPEIINEKPYNNKVDIWALGCIIHELCTLNFCFESNSVIGLVRIIQKNQRKKINKEIYGEELQNLIDSLLIEDPNKRPSIEDILQIITLQYRNHIIENIEKIFEEDEVYENYRIEKNIENSLDQVSLTVIERENKYSRTKIRIGIYIIAFATSFMTGGLSFISHLALCWGAQFLFIRFSENIIGQNYKETFIKDNQIIIQSIQEKMLKRIAERLDKNLLNEKIIVYSKEKFDEKIQKIKDKLISSKYVKRLQKIITKNFNILLVGCTNAGKSTLINEFLKLDKEKKAKESEGGPTDTVDFTLYEGEKNNKQYSLYDTNGITNNGVDSIEMKIKNTLSEIGKRIESKDPNQLIHCIWYCLQGSNVQPSDAEFIKKLLEIYTSFSIPIIFVHTQTYNLDQSKTCKKGIKKYITEIYKNDEEKIKAQLKNYVNVLARGSKVDEKGKNEDDDEEEEEKIKVKPIEPFGLDKLETITKKEIEIKGFKSAYYEFIKKDIIPILINGVFNLIFTENNIKNMTDNAKEDLDKYLNIISKILGDEKLGLTSEIINNNEKCLKKVYESFKNIRNTLKNDLIDLLKMDKLISDNKDLVKEVYENKSETYKKNMNFNTFSKNVKDLIYDNMTNNSINIINNILNIGFNFFVIEIIKVGIKAQFEEKEEITLSEIYTALFKENK